MARNLHFDFDEETGMISTRRKKRIISLGRVFSTLFRHQGWKYKIIRLFITFPIGLLLGILLYKVTIGHTSIEENSKRLVGYAVIVSVAVGVTSSRQIRCVLSLIVPVMAGRHGRTLLAAYAMTLVIGGPIENTIANFGDMARCAACLAKLRYNMTAEKLKLKFEPIWEIVKQLELVGQKSKDAVKNQEREWLPVKREIGDNREVIREKEETEETDRKLNVAESRVEMIKKKIALAMKSGSGFGNYTEKNAFRCEDIYNRAVKECLDALSSAHQRCKDKFGIVSGLVCWGFTQSSTCNRLDGRKDAQKCVSDQGSPDGFGEGYETMDEATNHFSKEFEYSLTAKMSPWRENIDDVTPVEVAKTLEREFLVRKKFLRFGVTLIRHFVSFTFLLVVLDCQKYLNKYLTKIDYDNKYVTAYFRRLDAGRRSRGKLNLLPVKKSEMGEICEPFKLSLTKSEAKKIGLVITPLVLQVVAASIIMAFDFLTWQTMDMLKRLGRMEYRAKGVHIVRLTVFGNGFMADLTRDIVKNLSVEKYIDEVHSNSRCLPSPTKTDLGNILRVYLVYAFVLALIYLEIYVRRTRPIVCGIFFPKRQKKRVLFFYNQRLKKKKNYIRHAIDYVKKKAATKKSWDSSLSSRFGLGRLENLLKRIRGHRCTLCDQKVHQPVQCANDQCPIVYCPQCWRELGQICHACQDEIN